MSQTRVQPPAWIGSGELLEEPEELLVAVAGSASVGDAAGRDLQRSEQGGSAMSDVVVGAALRASRPDAAHKLSAFHGWIWTFIFISTHSTTARWGGCR